MIYFRDNLYVIKTLKEFQYIDEEGKDQGANVRQKAKDISNLLTDESRLRQERRSRASMRDRMAGSSNGLGDDADPGENENVRRRSRSLPPRRATGRGNDDDELRRAIEASKQTAADEEARKGTMTAEERDLMQAIKLSEEEERKRNDSVTNANQSSLFDEQQNQLWVFNVNLPQFTPLIVLFHAALISEHRQTTRTRSRWSIRACNSRNSDCSPNSPRCSRSLRPSIPISSKHSKKRCRQAIFVQSSLSLSLTVTRPNINGNKLARRATIRSHCSSNSSNSNSNKAARRLVRQGAAPDCSRMSPRG